jgi:hypothetical protein
MAQMQRSFELPTGRALGWLFFGGLVGHFCWEAWARIVTPILIWAGPLQPAALIIGLIQNVFGINLTAIGQDQGWALAEFIHYATGVFFYPIGYLILFRYLVDLGLWVNGILWGIITWILALGVFAFLAGQPFMLGWIPLTWMSLIGHVIYAVVAAYIFERHRDTAMVMARA